jgi:hypothetical protein
VSVAKNAAGGEAWRRERRKGFTSAYDAANQAESRNYAGGFFKKD